ncbi:hypothetical protein [Photobacterium kasasachensis]|uniref:hypothetical protein n=1 Tax=Photobacterium kasasachensis TaxID=2910240 RepID=UPI003D0DC338
MSIFDNSIRRRIAKRFDDIPENNLKRFHSKEGDLVELPSGELIAISNQWSIGNTLNLIERVKRDDFVVEKVN